MSSRQLHKLLVLVLVLALQAAPGVATWHTLTAHHDDAAGHAALSEHDSDCPLCELAHHRGDHAFGPEAPASVSLAQSAVVFTPPPRVAIAAPAHDPHAPRAPPLS